MTTITRTQTSRSSLSVLLHETFARLQQHVTRVRTKRLLRELDDHQLKDIGLSRSDLQSW